MAMCAWSLLVAYITYICRPSLPYNCISTYQIKLKIMRYSLSQKKPDTFGEKNSFIYPKEEAFVANVFSAW